MTFLMQLQFDEYMRSPLKDSTIGGVGWAGCRTIATSKRVSKNDDASLTINKMVICLEYTDFKMGAEVGQHDLSSHVHQFIPRFSLTSIALDGFP